jgi:DNA-binding FadR family transcriptional regulator
MLSAAWRPGTSYMATQSSVQTQPPVYRRDLARLILARCEEPGYAPAGKLPTERSLAAEFGVTRTMVRHALTALEAEGRMAEAHSYSRRLSTQPRWRSIAKPMTSPKSVRPT